MHYLFVEKKQKIAIAKKQNKAKQSKTDVLDV
jgi:hypothetical protein